MGWSRVDRRAAALEDSTVEGAAYFEAGRVSSQKPGAGGADARSRDARSHDARSHDARSHDARSREARSSTAAGDDTSDDDALPHVQGLFMNSLKAAAGLCRCFLRNR